MVYDTVSVRQVISKVLTDSDLHEENHHLADMIEWAGEALEKIGAFPQLEVRVAGKGGEPLLRINDYQARLPLGLHSIIQAVYKPTSEPSSYLLPMRYSSGSFEHVPGLSDAEIIMESSTWTLVDTAPINAGQFMLNTTTNKLYINSVDDQGFFRGLDNLGIGNYIRITDTNNTAEHIYGITEAIHSGNNHVFSLDPVKVDGDFVVGESETITLIADFIADENFFETSRTMDYVYVVSDGWLKTNVRDGYVMLSYTRIPIDEEGYPKVPNNISYLEALYWYINMKMNYPRWVNGEIRDGVYFEMRRSWNYYRKQAYAEAMMPEGDQLQAIKNTWNQLIPTIDAENSFYSGVGEREYVYNQNKRTWPLLYNHSTRE